MQSIKKPERRQNPKKLNLTIERYSMALEQQSSKNSKIGR